MSSGSSSEDGFVWALGILGVIRYYVWDLTLCRIGHLPTMTMVGNISNGQVKGTLSCRRCHRVLRVSTMPAIKERTCWGTRTTKCKAAEEFNKQGEKSAK